MSWRRLPLLLALCALPLRAFAADPEGALQVTGVEGKLRLLRFETEPWPVEAGRGLPDNSSVELEEGARLRLSFNRYLDFCLGGPARMTVYVVPAPAAAELDQDRVVLTLGEGSLLVDGRFQFSRPAELILNLPDRSVPLPVDERFVVTVHDGRSRFYRVTDVIENGRQGPAWAAIAVEPGIEGSEGHLLAPAAKPEKKLPFDADLLRDLDKPVTLFILARDFNKDLGVWPRPAILGPLLTERLGKVPGLTVVEGSGNTYFAYRANGALKSGDDEFLKQLAKEHGAQWVLAGNVVAESLHGPESRLVQGQAELRVLETGGEDGGLELVSEAGTTRVARAGRAIELAAREAMEAASDEATGHLEWQLGNLLAGRPHGQTLLKAVLEGADAAALSDFRARLAGMDAVQKVFRRGYSKKRASFDLLLRKSLDDFDAQWAAWPKGPVQYQALSPTPGAATPGFERRWVVEGSR